MCGIMGYTGVLPATPIIIKGLEKLQYRGYDSAGIGLLNKNEIKVYKTVGSPEKLWDKVPERNPYARQARPKAVAFQPSLRL